MSTASAGAWPQAITSALSSELLGARSLAPAVSAARSAKPSTPERSNGGTSIGATRSRGEHAAERIAERDRLGGKRREVEMLREALARDLRRHDLEELLLARRSADGGEQIGGSGDRVRAFPSWQRPHLDARACRKSFAVGRDQDVAVGARERLQRQIAGGERLDALRHRAAPARPRRGRASRRSCGSAPRAWPCSSSLRPAQPRQHAAAEREPDRERGVEATGHDQHRPRSR